MQPLLTPRSTPTSTSSASGNANEPAVTSLPSPEPAAAAGGERPPARHRRTRGAAPSAARETDHHWSGDDSHQRRDRLPHVNFAWRSLDRVKYPRHDDSGGGGGPVVVLPYDGVGDAITVPRGMMLKTRALLVARDAYLACAAYSKDERCDAGSECEKVHVVHIDASARLFAKVSGARVRHRGCRGGKRRVPNKNTTEEPCSVVSAKDTTEPLPGKHDMNTHDVPSAPEQQPRKWSQEANAGSASTDASAGSGGSRAAPADAGGDGKPQPRSKNTKKRGGPRRYFYRNPYAATSTGEAQQVTMVLTSPETAV